MLSLTLPSTRPASLQRGARCVDGGRRSTAARSPAETPADTPVDGLSLPTVCRRRVRAMTAPGRSVLLVSARRVTLSTCRFGWLVLDRTGRRVGHLHRVTRGTEDVATDQQSRRLSPQAITTTHRAQPAADQRPTRRRRRVCEYIGAEYCAPAAATGVSIWRVIGRDRRQRRWLHRRTGDSTHQVVAEVGGAGTGCPGSWPATSARRASTSRGMSGSSCEGGRGSSRTCWYATATGESPRNGGTPGQELVEQHPGGVDVAAGVDGSPRACSGDRYCAVPITAAVCVIVVADVGDCPCDAEVHHLDDAVAGEHHVPGLDVAVDDAGAGGCSRGRRSTSGGDLQRALGRSADGRSRADVAQGAPLDVLHDDVRDGDAACRRASQARPRRCRRPRRSFGWLSEAALCASRRNRAGTTDRSRGRCAAS